MRKQYKKARYKRAALRKADREYPGIQAFRNNLKELRKAIEKWGEAVAKGMNKMLVEGKNERNR